MNGTNGSFRLAVCVILGFVFLLATALPRTQAFSIDGLWLSDGYGLLVEINGNKMSVYEITSISCLPAETAQKSEGGQSSNEVIFKEGNSVIRISPGSSANSLVMHEDGSISNIDLHRTAQKPKACNETLADTPQNNYAVFWQTYAEQFALFPVYHSDWAGVDRKYRSRVTSATTPDELFAIFREMVEPFQNAHISISGGSSQRQYHGYRPASEFGLALQKVPPPSLRELFTKKSERTKDIIESRYAEGKLRPYCNNMIYFGMLKGSIGYVRILGFNSYTKSGGFADGSAALEAALDDMFKQSADMKGLVIDVRLNTGGADPWGVDIAARLTRDRYLAYSKVIRNNLTGRLHFTKRQPAWVTPSSRPGFYGNVALLIGPDVVSAGETFSMALMGRTPRITFIGENTQGVFSDVLGRKLPNGWHIGLPNEVYLTKTGKAYDGPGVPPHVLMTVFSSSDLESGRDTGIERAAEVLAESPANKPGRQ